MQIKDFSIYVSTYKTLVVCIFLYTASFVASLQCAATGPDPSFSIRGKQDGDDGSGSLGEYALALGGIDVVVKQPVP